MWNWDGSTLETEEYEIRLWILTANFNIKFQIVFLHNSQLYTHTILMDSMVPPTSTFRKWLQFSAQPSMTGMKHWWKTSGVEENRRSVQQLDATVVATITPFIHPLTPVFSLTLWPADASNYCHNTQEPNFVLCSFIIFSSFGFMVICHNTNRVFKANMQSERPIIAPWPCIMTNCH